MKKLLAYGLILSILTSFGSVCFANGGGDGGNNTAINGDRGIFSTVRRIKMDVNAIHAYKEVVMSHYCDDPEEVKMNFDWHILIQQADCTWERVLGNGVSSFIPRDDKFFSLQERSDYICKFEIIYDDGSKEEEVFSLLELFASETRSLELNGVYLTLYPA